MCTTLCSAPMPHHHRGQTPRIGTHAKEWMVHCKWPFYVVGLSVCYFYVISLLCYCYWAPGVNLWLLSCVNLWFCHYAMLSTCPVSLTEVTGFSHLLTPQYCTIQWFTYHLLQRCSNTSWLTFVCGLSLFWLSIQCKFDFASLPWHLL